jgi:hypothetical protein
MASPPGIAGVPACPFTHAARPCGIAPKVLYRSSWIDETERKLRMRRKRKRISSRRSRSHVSRKQSSLSSRSDRISATRPGRTTRRGRHLGASYLSSSGSSIRRTVRRSGLTPRRCRSRERPEGRVSNLSLSFAMAARTFDLSAGHQTRRSHLTRREAPSSSCSKAAWRTARTCSNRNPGFGFRPEYPRPETRFGP